jgi:hypothetical protein
VTREPNKPPPHPDGREEGTVDLDRAGRRLLVGSGQVLAGLLAVGLLQHVRTPGTLVDVIAPQIPPGEQRDQLVFMAGAAAGLWAGQQRARPEWDPRELAAAAADLYAAGFAAMGDLAADAAAAPPGPPAGAPAPVRGTEGP